MILSDKLHELSVRLSIDGELIGSGFLLNIKEQGIVYLLTARHVLDEVSEDEIIDVASFNYHDQKFIDKIQVNISNVIKFPETDETDIALWILSNQVLPDLATVSANETVPGKIDIHFDGFPAAYKGEEPLPVMAKLSRSFYNKSKIRTDQSFEDNSSTALANVKGTSGSGLYWEREGEMILVGIITNYEARFKLFTAYHLSEVNRLLELKGYQTIELANIQPQNDPVAIVDSQTSFINQSRILLEQAENQWLTLHPRNCLHEAIMVRSNAEKESIPQPHLNVLLAQSYYLEALAKGDFRPVEEAGELFIKAYKLKSDTVRYKERAAMAYHQKKDDAEASRLVDEILEQDEFNPKAWNILLLLEPGVAVPTEVQKNPMFKVGELHRIAQANSRLKLSDFGTLFVYELETRPPVTKLDRTVLFYWTYVAQYVMHYFFERSGRRLDLQKPHELIGDPDLTYARDIFLQIDKFVKGTEFADHAMFQVARFDLLYCQYFLTDDAEVDQRLTGELFQLFVGSPQNSVSKLLWGDLDPISKVIPQRILDLLSILYSQGQGERMLEAIDALPEALTPMVFLFRGLAFSILKRKPDAIEAYRQFLLQTIEIDDFDACNILTVIQTLIREGQKTEDIEKWALEAKHFEAAYLEPLLKAFIESANPEKRANVKTNADQVLPHWSALPLQLQQALAVIYLDNQEYQQAKELFKKLVKPGEESDALRFYLFTLFEERKEIDEFLTQMAYWRTHFTPDLDLLLREAALFRSMNRYEGLLEVSVFGMHHFSDRPLFWIDRINALHQLGRHDELLPLLDERLLSLRLPTEIRFNLAHIYLLHGQHELGLEASYRELKANWNNVQLKNIYFSRIALADNLQSIPTPDTAEPNMVVRLASQDKRPLIELTPDRISSDLVAKNILGKGVGDTFTYKRGDLEETYKVDQLFNKYSGQAMLIAEEAKHNPMNGTGIESFEIDFSAPEKFFEFLQERYGTSGTELKLLSNDARHKFSKGEIGFLEVTLRAFGGNPISAWSFITSDHGDGFPIAPIVSLPKFEQSEELEFILDFSSLLIMFQLGKGQTLTYLNKPFIVSQYIIDYLRSELEKALFEKESQLAFLPQVDHVIPIYHAEGWQNRRAEEVQQLLDWIKTNCRPDYAPERLEWERYQKSEEQPLFSDKEKLKSSFLDTMLLANRPNRVLISDDMIWYKSSFDQHIVSITSEYFLRTTKNEIFQSSLWLKLVRLNFRGLTLTGDQVYQCFSNNKLLISNTNDFRKSQFSVEARYNPNTRNIITISVFLKNLYADNLKFDYKRQISRDFLLGTLKGVPLNYIEQLKSLIKTGFKFLPLEKEAVCEDIELVLSLIHNSSK